MDDTLTLFRDPSTGQPSAIIDTQFVCPDGRGSVFNDLRTATENRCPAGLDVLSLDCQDFLHLALVGRKAELLRGSLPAVLVHRQSNSTYLECKKRWNAKNVRMNALPSNEGADLMFIYLVQSTAV